MSGYIGINGKARNIVNGYIGIDGKARNIIKCYIGDENRKAKLLLSFDKWDGTTLKTINGSNVSNYNINSISFVENYTPSGSENSTWDATSQNNNKIIGYIVDNKDIIIVYKDKIYLSKNSPIKFSGYEKLSSLDLSSFNTNKVTDMSNMFYGCSNLTELNLSNFDTSNVTDMNYMFCGCSKLNKIILNNTTPPPINKILGQIPTSAKIYVPAESVETYKTNWSKYASRILAIE